MILSNVSLHKALDEGSLVIEPEPRPRRVDVRGDSCPYQTSAVDLSLGNEISWLKDGLPIAIDLREGGFSRLFTADNTETRVLKHSEGFTLQPGKFILAKTHELVELPIRDRSPWLAARVEGRSSYARCGLLVHFTAPTVHCGFRGHITLEMMNFGRYPISLYAGAPICQLIVEQVDAQPFRNDSQFHGQTRPGGTR